MSTKRFYESIVVSNKETHGKDKMRVKFFDWIDSARLKLSQALTCSPRPVSTTMSKGGDYDAVYKELDKLDVLHALSRKKASSVKSKTKSIPASLDALLASLRDAKQQLSSRSRTVEDVTVEVTEAVETSKKEIEDRQKEIYNSLNRMGKALDKVSHIV